VYGDARVYGDVRVYGHTIVYGHTKLRSSLVRQRGDFLHIVGLFYNVTVQNDNIVNIGCKSDTVENWMKVTFESQNHILFREDFDTLKGVLGSMIPHYLDNIEKHKTKMAVLPRLYKNK
jgi:hypothetical protein